MPTYVVGAKGEGRGQDIHVRAMQTYAGMEMSPHSFSTLVLGGDEWLASCPDCCDMEEGVPLPPESMELEDRWVSERFWAIL